MKRKAVPKQCLAPTKAKPRQALRGRSAGAVSESPVLSLFDRVATILDAARSGVVRAVNSQMVLAYWHIGREIVQELQGGEERAEYGQGVLRELSHRLTERYGRGFSVTNLQNFRQFYLVYRQRAPGSRLIHQTTSGESGSARIHQTPSDESAGPEIGQTRSGLSAASPRATTASVLADLLEAAETVDAQRGFSPLLGWSHYQELMKVEHRSERLFYEIEAEKERWDVRLLRRQIQSLLFARLLKSRNKAGVLALATEGQTLTRPLDAIKDPYVLDFLNLPDSEKLHEQGLEAAIVSHLQAFLLELGKGFAFIARQKRMTFGDQFFYLDLVFYHCLLKCYVLIDLKIGALTHQDIGQMDGYVRMWDERGRSAGDNPTIGLILCTEKSQTIARYSVLQESQQLFASKYRIHLPTEEELAAELKREVLALEEGRGE